MEATISQHVNTGIEGLDEILLGGFLPGRTYLVRGGPGTGKTTLGLHFLSAANKKEEKALFITLQEAESTIRSDARAIGLDLSEIAFLDLSPTSEFFEKAESYDIFSPAEVEREPIMKRIANAVDSIGPARVFLDPLTQFRYLATDPFQFRKQVLSFFRFLTEHGATVVFTSEGSMEAPDEDLQFMADGIIQLEKLQGARSLEIIKARGSDFRKEKHSIALTNTGMKTFPKIVPGEYWKEYNPETISSGIPEFDELLGGGLERGTVTLITGPTGIGKTTFGLQFFKEAANRNERSVIYSFDEAPRILISRCEAINIPVRDMISQGALAIEKIEPLQYSTGEFAQIVRCEVEQKSTRFVMIDSIAGYMLAGPKDQFITNLHAICKYLQHMGVAVFVIAETANVFKSFRASDVGISYLADNIVFFRYFEKQDELCKAVGVLKKRLTDFEKTMRSFEITHNGIAVGMPVDHIRDVLGLPGIETPKYS